MAVAADAEEGFGLSDATGEVRNDVEGHRFVIELDGVEAELVYRERAGRLILIHTGVPDALGGRGIGGRLVTAAATYARSKELTIVPWCPFARDWLTKHADAVEGIAIDWDTMPPAEDSVTT